MGAFSEIDMDMKQNSTSEAWEQSNPFQLEPNEESRTAFTQEFSDEEELSTEEESAEQEPQEEETDTPVDLDDAEAIKRTEHEAAEAKRKTEWETEQQERKTSQKEQADRIAAMTDDEVMMLSMKRVDSDTEKLTRRTMKDCVSEYLQTKCLEEADFARLVMHPKKSMIHCFWYINRMGQKYIEQEVLADNPTPQAGVYGSDVPDDLCYQWAEEYFRDANAPEDEEKTETFVPKPYVGRRVKPTNPKEKKITEKKAPGKKPEVKPPADDGQLSFVSQLSMSDFAVSETKAG